MEIVLIMLTGTLMGALLVGAFYLGVRYGENKQTNTDAVELNDRNKEAISEMVKWLNYGGK